jgi:hypothetical protein
MEYENNLYDRINLSTHAILNHILNRLINPKFSFERAGVRWTLITTRELVKPHCRTRSASSHIKLLVDIGIIVKKQLFKEDGNCANCYAINPLLSVDILKKIEKFFARPIAQKLRDIIIRNNNKKIILDLGNRGCARPASSPRSWIPTETLKIWNQVTGENERLDSHYAQFLQAAFNLKFKTLEKWKEFCLLVKESSYLAAAKIKTTLLRYCLKFDVIDKIIGGKLKKFEEKRRLREDELMRLKRMRELRNKQTEDHIQNIYMNALETKKCVKIRDKIYRKYGSEFYLSYAANVRMEETGLPEAGLINAAGAPFFKDRVQQSLDSVYNSYVWDSIRKRRSRPAKDVLPLSFNAAGASLA